MPPVMRNCLRSSSFESDGSCGLLVRRTEELAWRKYGIHARTEMLRNDEESGASNFTLNQSCDLKNYYDIADRVLEQFLVSIQDPERLDESYLVGNRLIKFLSVVLPTHRQFYSKDFLLTKLRVKSRNDLASIGVQVDEAALKIDKRVYDEYLWSYLQHARENEDSHLDSSVPLHILEENPKTRNSKKVTFSLKSNRCESLDDEIVCNDVSMSFTSSSTSSTAEMSESTVSTPDKDNSKPSSCLIGDSNYEHLDLSRDGSDSAEDVSVSNAQKFDYDDKNERVRPFRDQSICALSHAPDELSAAKTKISIFHRSIESNTDDSWNWNHAIEYDEKLCATDPLREADMKRNIPNYFDSLNEGQSCNQEDWHLESTESDFIQRERQRLIDKANFAAIDYQNSWDEDRDHAVYVENMTLYEFKEDCTNLNSFDWKENLNVNSFDHKSSVTSTNNAHLPLHSQAIRDDTNERSFIHENRNVGLTKIKNQNLFVESKIDCKVINFEKNGNDNINLQDTTSLDLRSRSETNSYCYNGCEDDSPDEGDECDYEYSVSSVLGIARREEYVPEFQELLHDEPERSESTWGKNWLRSDPLGILRRLEASLDLEKSEMRRLPVPVNKADSRSPPQSRDDLINAHKFFIETSTSVQEHPVPRKYCPRASSISVCGIDTSATHDKVLSSDHLPEVSVKCSDTSSKRSLYRAAQSRVLLRRTRSSPVFELSADRAVMDSGRLGPKSINPGIKR